jgi:hypothetical protein
MNDPCPVCGLLFQREEGSFLGAMYVSYLLGSAILVPLYFITAALFPDWSTIVVALVVMLPYLLFAPAVFRYSRVIWVHFDRASDPTGICGGAYEKDRLRRLEEEGRGRPPRQAGMVPGTKSGGQAEASLQPPKEACSR